MRLNCQDETIKRNYLQKYRFLINEYELVKQKKHKQYRLAKEFYEAHAIDHRTFLKYYNRYKQSGKPQDLLPRKRGPRWKTRRPVAFIELKVVELRYRGMNRYEIWSTLKPRLKRFTPSPSGIYQILRRYGVSRMNKKMKSNKRAIIKEKAGELAHADAHHLSRDIVLEDRKPRYLVCVVDACTRIAWAEVVEDIKSLTVMFATMKMFNIINVNYKIQFAEILTDNGPEYGPRDSKKKAEHPFERMLTEMGIKHRYTRPYRPQTNGKAERFWRTMEEDLLRETTFEDVEELRKELEEYLYYYNHMRPHQALGGKTPVDFAENCPRIV